MIAAVVVVTVVVAVTMVWRGYPSRLHSLQHQQRLRRQSHHLSSTREQRPYKVE